MKKIFYFNMPAPTGNAGDDVLAFATIRIFESFGHEIEWVFFPLTNYTPPAVMDKANECDVVLIGGHGLLMSDTNRNESSGWQWRCPIDTLKKLNTPLIFYAIGYNMMEGQESFHPVFDEHIQLVARKSSFFSVRNNQSRLMLSKHGIPIKNILVQHCPSLFIKPEKKIELSKMRPRIGISLAGDRMHLRVRDKNAFYSEMRKLVISLNVDFQICFINHNWNPTSNCQEFIESVCEDMDDARIYNIETIWDYDNDVEYVINLYRSMNVVLAMRGHAQLISFGQSIPIISLISHNKLRWFLEDVNMPDTGVEVFDGFFADRVKQLVEKYINDPEEWLGRWRPAYHQLASNFDRNNHWIKENYFK